MIRVRQVKIKIESTENENIKTISDKLKIDKQDIIKYEIKKQ